VPLVRIMLTGIENYIQHGRGDVLHHGALGLVLIIPSVLLCDKLTEAGPKSSNWDQLLLCGMVLPGTDFWGYCCRQLPRSIQDHLPRDGVHSLLLLFLNTTGPLTMHRLSVCGVLVLFITSLPPSLEHGGGLPGLMLALILIGLGYVLQWNFESYRVC
jgi:POT family proton-dependent oligopeptide transporter